METCQRIISGEGKKYAEVLSQEVKRANILKVSFVLYLNLLCLFFFHSMFLLFSISINLCSLISIQNGGLAKTEVQDATPVKNEVKAEQTAVDMKFIPKPKSTNLSTKVYLYSVCFFLLILSAIRFLFDFVITLCLFRWVKKSQAMERHPCTLLKRFALNCSSFN